MMIQGIFMFPKNDLLVIQVLDPVFQALIWVTHSDFSVFPNVHSHSSAAECLSLRLAA